MIDWKILAASVVAIAIISSIAIGGSGVGDFFGEIFDSIKNLFGGSPLGGFFSVPETRTKSVEIALYPSEISVAPDKPFSLSLGDSEIRNIKGTIGVDFAGNKTITIKEKDSDLEILIPLKPTEFEEIDINKLILKGIGFDIKSNIKTENGTIEIYNFFGVLGINNENIRLTGNVSRLKVDIEGTIWELKEQSKA